MQSNFWSEKYKNWWIHTSWTQNGEQVSIQSPDYKITKVKSLHAAKCLITRNQNAI